MGTKTQVIETKTKTKTKPMPKPKPKSKLKSKSKKPKQKLKSLKPKRILYSHGAYISCNECDACPIRGARYVCMVRENYNICEQCEDKLINNDKLQYPMIKIYKPRPNWHIKNFKGLQDLVAIPEMERIQEMQQQQKQKQKQ